MRKPLPSDHPARVAFAALLDAEVKAWLGVRLLKGSSLGVGGRSLQNYRRGRSLPVDIEPILKGLYGDDPVRSARLREAFQAACGLHGDRQPGAAAPQPPSGESPDAEGAPRTPAPTTQRRRWYTDQPIPARTGTGELLALTLYPPPQGDDDPGDFALSVSLNAGTRRHHDQAIVWEIGLRRYKVLAELTGCRLKKGSTLKSPIVSLQGSAWVVDAVDGALLGELVPGDDNLARVENNGLFGPMAVSLTAVCESTDLDISVRSYGGRLSDERVSANRMRFAKRLLQSFEADDQGRVSLGQASLMWDGPDAAE